MGRLRIWLNQQTLGTEIRDGRVVLRVTDWSGTPQELEADHVIAATGYRKC